MRLDAGRSIVTRFVNMPKYPGSISTSAGMLTAGRPRRLPMASAMSRNGMPPSSLACQYLPAGPFSSARRNNEATSRMCTAPHRFPPSPG